jgi:hypothetical protein
MITYENFEFRVDNVITAEQELLQRVIVIRDADSGMVMRFPLGLPYAEQLAAALTAPHIVIAQELRDQNGSHG